MIVTTQMKATEQCFHISVNFSYHLFMAGITNPMFMSIQVYTWLQNKVFMRQDSCKPIDITTFFLDCKSSLRCLKASTPDKLPSSRETTYESQMKNNELFRHYKFSYHTDERNYMSPSWLINIIYVHVQQDRM